MNADGSGKVALTRGHVHNTGRGGSDRLLGGRGADTFLTRDGARDVVDGGGGRDRARADRKLDQIRGVEERF